MDITKFTEKFNDKETFDYRMFIYGNYTYRSNLEADSLVVVLKNVIPYLTKRFKMHFTVMVPQIVNSLNFPNVEQVIYTLPQHINTMRCHFDTRKFLDIIDYRHNDFDIVYSHLPEHTAQLANVLYNNTNLDPSIIGETHWIEIDQSSPYELRMFPAALHGMLETKECGVHSQWFKELILNESKNILAQPLIQKLDKIIQPHYLGIDQIRPRSLDIQPKSVIFNHRSSTYTGWDWFSKIMDEVWLERQDFTVYVTLSELERLNKPWCQKLDLPSRQEYMNRLSTMQFGVGCFQEYSTWSISVTDGLSLNVPYLLPNNLCYPEMVGKNYPYLYNDEIEFKQKFHQMLDVIPTYDMTSIVEPMMWEARIEQWFKNWTVPFQFLERVKKNTPTVQRIVGMIRKNGYMTKKDIMDELLWGSHFKWSSYRHYMRKNVPEIRFTKDGYEWTT